MKVTHVSLWPPDDRRAERVKLRDGIITDEGRFARLTVSDGRARTRGVPADVNGWRVFVSRLEDGAYEHVYEGTVTEVERVSGMAGMRRLFRCEPGGVGGF
ncbi:hypothetical protein [Halovivax sp.]|uniref:hypothetical protein n=1 Tax=Halovivax sp. TaxID=1935978 RepID=UPI0025C19864|nr:hypothetical protein [Halovivax sp.]